MTFFGVMSLTYLGLILSPILILNIIVAAWVVFTGRKTPGVTWAWLFVIIMLPYIGIILYMMLGFDGRKRSKFVAKRIRDTENYREFFGLSQSGNDFINEQMDILKRSTLADNPGAIKLDEIVYLNMIAGRAAYTEGNDVQVFTEGGPKFDALVADILSARNSIFLQYFIVRNDSLAKRIVEALTSRAREGVQVCVLIDGLGCIFTRNSTFAPLISAGGEVATFMPLRLGALNYRNHRKIAVIDGRIGYIGGFNIGNEYLGLSKRFGFWRDTHLRIRGDAVHQLTLSFIMDWNFAQEKTHLALSSDLFPANNVQPGTSALQVLSSGPDTEWSSIQYAYMKMINSANSQILIQSPYFIPDDSILEALRIAALSGVDVRIMIPGHPDHPFVYWAALSYLGELLKAGVRCYEYEHGFLHTKVMVVDECIASIGTANLDVRSFRLNFEINTIIYDRQLAAETAAQFHKDAKKCTEITKAWYDARPRSVRIREALSRLVSPIL